MFHVWDSNFETTEGAQRKNVRKLSAQIVLMLYFNKYILPGCLFRDTKFKMNIIWQMEVNLQDLELQEKKWALTL